MANKNLKNARRAKNDEFYTQYIDIQKEVEAYLEYNPDVFRDKVVYCNCDDPFESNFFRYFVLNFNRFGLKTLITTSYKPSPVANTQIALFGNDKTPTKSKGRPKITANKFIINEVHDIDGDGEFNLKDVAKQLKANKHNEWMPLGADGDFRSDECVSLLKQSDIVVTNPPFSLFREYVKQLFDSDKKFLIIGSMNAITYKEIFPLLKDNKMWLGAGKNDGRNVWYQVPDSYENFHKKESGKKYAYVAGTVWFTNLDHGRRHQPLPLMTEKEIIKFVTKKPFEKYDNYDAIEVPLVKNIPSDYGGVMGVPISYLSKYNPEQFKILGLSRYTKTQGMSKAFVDAYYKSGQKGTISEGHPDLCYYDHNNRPVVPYMRVLIKLNKVVNK
ncbi:MAG: Modification methylase EcoRI [Candidatus Roizmanbacteria bacterium GW2011_GWA2_35_19]|uniref:Modification methylase EcoRI n=2 Tax=Candidatus Roizmaniibacteriota TaxID=1752723 RepID=A0A0G0BPW6_9BACT|nr:MAG: Modification methylase EcoRI [Candidatus Roizmanbacteria bacterium GW2011_GWC2_35_12]KKP71559.1 MAG: Modification methylase EcoRI [Candidatus Roizmanbacteria bacterium GW2011_GWA2_35_19]